MFTQIQIHFFCQKKLEAVKQAFRKHDVDIWLVLGGNDEAGHLLHAVQLRQRFGRGHREDG